jgi:hypothetical protein
MQGTRNCDQIHSESPDSTGADPGAPHFHAALRGTIPRAELRAITAATYHQVGGPPMTSSSTPTGGSQSGTRARRHSPTPTPPHHYPLSTTLATSSPNHPRRTFRHTGPHQRHPGRHRRSRPPHRIFGQEHWAGRRAQRARHRRPTRPRPAAARRTSGYPVLPSVCDVVAPRTPTPRRPTHHDARAVQRQGPQTRTPGHRRPPRLGVTQLVQQKPSMYRYVVHLPE